MLLGTPSPILDPLGYPHPYRIPCDTLTNTGSLGTPASMLDPLGQPAPILDPNSSLLLLEAAAVGSAAGLPAIHLVDLPGNPRSWFLPLPVLVALSILGVNHQMEKKISVFVLKQTSK